MDRNDQRSSQLLFWKLRRLDHGICVRINACKFTNVSERSEVRWETAHSVKSGAGGGGKCQSWWMTLQVLILLLLFRVCDGHRTSKAFHHLSQVAVLKVAKSGSSWWSLCPLTLFFFSSALQNKMRTVASPTSEGAFLWSITAILLCFPAALPSASHHTAQSQTYRAGTIQDSSCCFHIAF